jgi:hypothetical protein
MRWWFLTGLILLGVCGCTSAPRSPADLSDADVDRYRFGLYRDCVEAGTARIEPPSVTDAICDCVYEELEGQVGEGEWRQATFLFLSGREDEERRLLMPFLRQAAACHRLAAVETPGSGTGPAPADRLVGRWAWTRPIAHCRETYEFRSGGTVRMERGDERTENTYVVVPVPEASGRYQVSIATTWYAAGADCDGVVRDVADRKLTLHVLFGPRSEMLAVCKSAADPDCDGPLRRTLGD